MFFTPSPFILLPFIVPTIFAISIPFDSNRQQQQQKSTTELSHPKAMKMLSPQKLLPGQKILETDYFKPKEYSTRDFPRLIEGLGQQIRRDLGQAHSMMASYSKQVQNLEQRMDRLEQIAASFPQRNSLNEFGQQFDSKFLVILCFLLLASLATLLLSNFFLLRRLARSGSAGTKHIRLESSCSDQIEQI